MPSIDIVDRLRFDAARCEATFSKGVAGNIEEAAAEIERLLSTLNAIILMCDIAAASPIERRAIELANVRKLAVATLRLNQQQGGEK